MPARDHERSKNKDRSLKSGRRPKESIAPAQSKAIDDSFDADDPEYSLLVPEKQKAIDAIKLKLRTTAAEFATVSGLSINKSNYWLNKIAGETGAKLDIAKDGTVYYQFAPNFTNVYRKRGLLKAALLVGAFIFQATYWMVRVSFGVALVLSVLVIVVLIVAVILAALASIFGDNGGDGVDFGDSGGFFDFDFLGDLFRWDYSPSHSYYDFSIPSTRREKYASYVEQHPKGNFFLECFSFLFGDGKPNSNLQEIRWQKIARVVKANGGVVSAEQMAPYLDGDTSDSGMVMNALAQFNGHPEVTESGFIVYIFPDYLSEKQQELPQADQYLEEQEWRFSAFPISAQITVLTVAIFNFLGSWWLFRHIATNALLHHVAALIDVLLSYAIFLLVIPAARAIVLAVLNSRIHMRNERRRTAFELINKPQGEVLKELQEANAVRERELAINLPLADKEIIYSTDRDSLEQKFEEELEQ